MNTQLSPFTLRLLSCVFWPVWYWQELGRRIALWQSKTRVPENQRYDHMGYVMVCLCVFILGLMLASQLTVIPGTMFLLIILYGIGAIGRMAATEDPTDLKDLMDMLVGGSLSVIMAIIMLHSYTLASRTALGFLVLLVGIGIPSTRFVLGACTELRKLNATQ